MLRFPYELLTCAACVLKMLLPKVFRIRVSVGKSFKGFTKVSLEFMLRFPHVLLRIVILSFEIVFGQ